MQILGILIDKPLLRVALLEKSRGKFKIIYLNSHSYSDVKQLYTKGFKGKIISALAAQDILMRPVEINIGNSKHLDQALSFQTEAASHLDKEQIVSSFHILKKAKEKTSALLFTTTKQTVLEHLEALNAISFDPDSIGATPLALVNYFKWKNPAIEDGFFIDLGSQSWTCICMDQGVLKKFHAIEGGTERLLEALWEDRKKTLFPKEVPGIAKQIDLLQLKKELNPQLDEKIQEMKQELGRAIFSFCSSFGKKPLFFTGRIDAFNQLEEFLKEGLEECLVDGIEIELPEVEKKYALAIGSAVGFGESCLEFRKNEFFPKKTWRNLGKKCLFLMLASCTIGSALVGFSDYALKTKSKEMVSFLESSLEKWDPDLAKKVFSQKDEEEVLRRWDKAVVAHLKLPPYMGSYPKVAEALSWLYQHPLCQEKTDPIQIKSIRYQLVGYPHLEAPREPYQAKLELEFETTSALNARKFHEEIYAGNTLVDNKEDIQWDVSENTYQTSFFLKKEISHAF